MALNKAHPHASSMFAGELRDGMTIMSGVFGGAAFQQRGQYSRDGRRAADQSAGAQPGFGHHCGGALSNGFAPTALGCSSWGGYSISENLDYKHLMNISRIGKVITGKHVPTDEEIWAS